MLPHKIIPVTIVQFQQICKDKSEAEIWFLALQTLVSRGNYRKWGTEIKTDASLSGYSSDQTENSLSIVSNSSEDALQEEKQNLQISDLASDRLPQKRLEKVLSDITLQKTSSPQSPQRDYGLFFGMVNENVSRRNSADTFRLSSSSALSTLSQESSPGDIPLSIIFICGEGIEDGPLDGGMSETVSLKNAFSPKVLESASTLDAQHIALGSRHAVLITRQGHVFSWGDGLGGKLGHGSQADVPSPQLINSLSGSKIVSVGCGEYHTCAVTLSGDLYTWGDGVHNSGLLGHDTELSYWAPRKVRGTLEGICVTSVSCGPWHSAAITSLGQLFTFGDGTFGALGHGDNLCTGFPREILALKGQKAVKISCGFWHTAAIIEVCSESPNVTNSPTGKLFTWGNGDDGQLGQGDKLCRLIPNSVTMPNDKNFCQVACGQCVTVALTECGQVYSMGSTISGDTHMLPTRVEGKLKNCFVKEISCGSHHVVALTSSSEVFTWGKGKNGQLGHGDNTDRNSPTTVKSFEGRIVKRVVCGKNFTAVICLQQLVCPSDYSICARCRNPFSFKRKRHNCYNCGLFFCKACASNKSLGASLALNQNKLYRVCEDCFAKLKNGSGNRATSRPPKSSSSPCVHASPSNEPKKDSSKPRKPGLSSFNSFRRSTKLTEANQKMDSGSRNLRCTKSFLSSRSTSMFEICEGLHDSLQDSKLQSGSSPFSTKSSPAALSLPSLLCNIPDHEEVVDDPNQATEDLTEEISFLREQVQVLTQKSESLAEELERTSNQLSEATALFKVESGKNNAAKASIKYLTGQLKEMAARASQGPPCRAIGPLGDKTWHVINTAST
ncbi:Regulator of chromosome condensation (RCC1) family with FYVE zinc finger domain [Striga hermonthica]|uniref:Regulator of chromosome condensation (RCC1) family with FYVE zinc finger domain n=1 Tax=Striga hermonthica TaxID=68872 RepID=A0A9N7NAC2_STRHE|nr:Regulator of chromosome condensation (RCC1) family with FYVE zinc finger domain [Striga hermonthica]